MSVPPVHACVAGTRQRVTSRIGNKFETYASEAVASNDVARGEGKSPDIAIKGNGFLMSVTEYYNGQMKFEFGS